jgi:ferredoxin
VIVRVQDDICVGHGRCYVLASDVFGADDFGHCVVLVREPGDERLAEQARLGAANCPEQAIVIDASAVG